ncbi:MAG: hypothetical protein IJH34_12875 [Romboutsia sp.]|nr:hypothetical protein [Romboutsia sp.]
MFGFDKYKLEELKDKVENKLIDFFAEQQREQSQKEMELEIGLKMLQEKLLNKK